MHDRFNRNIHYLRISVTDRCNLRCVYCMPAEGVEPLSHSDVLSFEEITDFVRTAVKSGIDKVRITGGEPLVRKGIEKLVFQLSQIKEIKDLSMTTNGILLENYAETLKKAGLYRINISIDATDPEEYRKITRNGDVNMVFKGINAALKAGFTKIKINTVIEKSCDEKNCVDVAQYCRKMGFEHRLIRKMDLEKGLFWQVHGGEGGKCSECSRLRLTSNGLVLPCLFSDISFSVRELGAENAILKAVECKPQKGVISKDHHFYNVGG
ncbi:MAG TPA: radical SAM protein [bacterium]|nr:radical SAM protein [bacterium]